MLSSQDIERTLACLQALGAAVDAEEGSLIVQGMPQEFSRPDRERADLNVGESGTTCRLMIAVAAAGKKACRVHGQGRMHERPIGELAQALVPLGTNFQWEAKEGYPPFVLQAQGLSGGTTAISLEESSQYLSGLLLAAPLAQGELCINVQGQKAVSWPYVSLTLQVMEAFGLKVQVELLEENKWQQVSWKEVTQVRPGEIRFRISPQEYKPREFTVEGDWSNSSYFLAAAALGPVPVCLNKVFADSRQGDKAIVSILEKMGAETSWDGPALTVFPAQLQGADLDMGSCPDLVPTVAVLASMAQGGTRISNVAHLRIKESDRLQALANEIAKTGARIEVLEDGLQIDPMPLNRGARIDFCTYGDHRLAMSLSLFELAGIGVELDKPQCVAKSFPDFWQKWELIRQGSKGL
jgi:3-phosphoshikimate 1-carboxyvinyltransferase